MPQGPKHTILTLSQLSTSIHGFASFGSLQTKKMTKPIQADNDVVSMNVIEDGCINPQPVSIFEVCRVIILVADDDE